MSETRTKKNARAAKIVQYVIDSRRYEMKHITYSILGIETSAMQSMGFKSTDDGLLKEWIT